MPIPRSVENMNSFHFYTKNQQKPFLQVPGKKNAICWENITREQDKQPTEKWLNYMQVSCS